MVKYKTIIDVIDTYLDKCSDNPKYLALKYFKEHRDEFQKEEYMGNYDPDNHPGDTIIAMAGILFSTQASGQYQIRYSPEEQSFLQAYRTYVYTLLQTYINGDNDKFVSFVKKLQDTEFKYNLELVEGGDENNMKDWRIRDFKAHTMDEVLDSINYSIDKSPTLLQDTVLYGYARLPTDADGKPVTEGHAGTYKGLRGVSYTKKLVHDPNSFLHDNGWVDNDSRYNITYYCLKGTNGINLDKSVGCDNSQTERLFHSGQRAIVYEVNEDTREATVIIY